MKELLEKYLNGSATPEEIKVVDDWYRSLRDDRAAPEADADAEKVRLNEAWSRISGRMERQPLRERALWPKISAVAAVFVAVAMAVYFLTPATGGRDRADTKIERTETAGNVGEIENTTEDVRNILLSDGSTIALFPGSSLTVDDNFMANDRTVTLSGRASFDVAKDESKPFYVLTGEVVTKVVGTSFTIEAYPDAGEITVEVRSGAVSVYSNSNNHIAATALLLKPNQQAVYNKRNKRVLRTLVKQPRIVIPGEEVEKIRFEDAAVSEIFRTLEKMYGVEIEFDEQTFDSCSMTTALSRGDLYEKIDVICEITGAHYLIEDTRIVISGVGCQ